MQDLYHYFGNDLAVSATGDLALADDTTTGEQRVLRRLLTNPQLVNSSGITQASADYIFHPTYGGGLPRQVGQPANIPAVTAVVVGQMAQEAAVSQSPAPVVTVTNIQDGINCFVQFNDAASQSPVVLDFDVTN